MRMHGMNQCVSSASVLLLRYITCNHMILMISVKNQIRGKNMSYRMGQSHVIVLFCVSCFVQSQLQMQQQEFEERMQDRERTSANNLQQQNQQFQTLMLQNMMTFQATLTAHLFGKRKRDGDDSD